MSDSNSEEAEVHTKVLKLDEAGEDGELSGAAGYNVKTTCTMCLNDQPVQKYCSTCEMWLCATCVDMHSRVPVFRSHTLSDKEDKPVVSYDVCKQHPRSLLQYFCRPCAQPICSDCWVNGHGNHVDHHCITIERQADMNMKRLESNSELVSEDLKKYELRKQMLEEELLALNTEQTQMKSYIDRCEQHMKKIFDQWRLISSRQHSQLSTEIRDVLDLTQNNIDSLTTLQRKSKDNITLTKQSMMVSPEHNIVFDKTGRFTKGIFAAFDETVVDMKQFVTDKVITDDSSANKTKLWIEAVDKLSQILKQDLTSAAVKVLNERKISFVDFRHVHEALEEDQFTVVASDWVKNYTSFISNGKQNPLPQPVRCYENGKKRIYAPSSIYMYMSYTFIHNDLLRLVSKAEMLLLWRMFGHAEDEPMPKCQKEGFVSDGRYYIALVTEVDEESGGWKRYGQTLTVLRHLGADLPPGDVYYEDQPNKIDKNFKPETNYCHLYVVNK